MSTYNLLLQTVPNQAIFSIQAGVCHLFREFLTSEGFHEVHTPKIISGLEDMKFS